MIIRTLIGLAMLATVVNTLRHPLNVKTVWRETAANGYMIVSLASITKFTKKGSIAGVRNDAMFNTDIMIDTKHANIFHSFIHFQNKMISSQL